MKAAQMFNPCDSHLFLNAGYECLCVTVKDTRLKGENSNNLCTPISITLWSSSREGGSVNFRTFLQKNLKTTVAYERANEAYSVLI
jgi:hypothetical protein